MFQFDAIVFKTRLSPYYKHVRASYNSSGRSFASCLGGPRFDPRPIQTKDFKLVVEAPLPCLMFDMYKSISRQKLVDPLPE